MDSDAETVREEVALPTGQLDVAPQTGTLASMSGTTRLALFILAVGAFIVAGGLLRFPRNDLVPVDEPIRIESGESHSASFVARFAHYEIGISTLRRLDIRSRCPTARDAECVGGLRPYFADRCRDRPPILELSVLVKADGQPAPIRCRAGTYREPPFHWQELWLMDAEPGREYELEVTVVGGDPHLQRFDPSLLVRADRDLGKEKAVELAYAVLGGGLVAALGLALLIGGLVWSRLRSKA